MKDFGLSFLLNPGPSQDISNSRYFYLQRSLFIPAIVCLRKAKPIMLSSSGERLISTKAALEAGPCQQVIDNQHDDIV